MDPTTPSMGGVMQRTTPTTAKSGNMSQQQPPTPHSTHPAPPFPPPPAMQQRPSLPSPSQHRPPQQSNEYEGEQQDQGAPPPSSQLITYVPPPPPPPQNAIILAAPVGKRMNSLPPAPDVFSVDQHHPSANRDFEAQYGNQTASRHNADYDSEEQPRYWEEQSRAGHQADPQCHPQREQSHQQPQQAHLEIQQRQQSTVPVPDPKIQRTPGRNPFAIPPSPSNVHPASSPGTIVTPNRRSDPTNRMSTDPIAANRTKQSSTKDGTTYILPPPGKTVLIKRGSKGSQSGFKVPWAEQPAGENMGGSNSSPGQGQALGGQSSDQAAQGDRAGGQASQLNRQPNEEQQRVSQMLSAHKAAAQKRAQAIMQSSGTEIYSPGRNQGQSRAQDIDQSHQPKSPPHATPSTPTQDQGNESTQIQPSKTYDPRSQKPPLPLKQHIPSEQFQAIVPQVAKQTGQQLRNQNAKSPAKIPSASNTRPQLIPPRPALTENQQTQGGHARRNDRDQRQNTHRDDDHEIQYRSQSQHGDRSSPSPQYGQNVEYMGHRHDDPSQGFADTHHQGQDQDVEVDEYIGEEVERPEVNVCDYAYDDRQNDQYGKQDYVQRNDQYDNRHPVQHGEQQVKSSKSQGKRSRDHTSHDNDEQEAAQASTSSKKRQKHEPNRPSASSETMMQEGTEVEEEEDEGVEFDVFAETEKYDYVSELQEPWNQMMDEMVPFIDDWAEKFLATSLDTIFSVYGCFNNMSKINAESLEQGVKDILAYQDTQSEIRQTLVDFRDGVTQISKRLVSAPKSRGETPQGQA